MTDGATLKEKKEKVHGADEHNDCEDGVDDVNLVEFAGEAQEVDPDR